MNKKIILLLALITLLTVSSVHAYTINDGLKFWFEFNSSKLDRTTNFSGQLLNGATYASGKVGKALTTDGTDDYFDTKFNQSSIMGSQFTIAVWIKTTDNIGDYLSVSSNAPKTHHRWIAGSDLRLYQEDSASDALDNTFVATSPNDNTWHYYVLRVNATGGNYKLFDNGQNLTYNAANTPTSMSDIASMALGCRLLGGTCEAGKYTQALFDEFALWNRWLNDTEVNYLYNKGNGIGYPNSTSPPPSPTPQNFSIDLKDLYDSTSITGFSALIQGVGRFNTAGTNLTTTLLHNNTNQYTIIVSSNTSGGYFNVTITNYNISSSHDYHPKAYQSELRLTAQELITLKSITGGNFSAPLQSKSVGNALKLKAGTYTITFTNSSYLSTSKKFTVTPLQNTTGTINNVANGVYLFNASNYLTGTPINTFTILINFSNVTHSYQEINTTTNGTIRFKLLQGLNYTSIISNSGLSNANLTDTLNSSFQYKTYKLYTTNSINFTFRDEKTQNVLYGQKNIIVELISPSVSYNYTANGTLYIDLITPENYKIRYSKPGYGILREYNLRLTNGSHNVLNLYLLNSTISDQITVNVFEETTIKRLKNSTVYLLRYSQPTNTYNTVAMYTTDENGQAYFDIEQSNELYQFFVDYPWLTRRLVTTPAYINSGTITLYVNIDSQFGQVTDSINSMTTMVTHNYNSNSFTASVTDPSNTADRYCLTIKKTGKYTFTQVNQSCTTNPSSSITLQHPNDNETYIAILTGRISNKDYVIASGYNTGFSTELNTPYALYLAILLYITMLLASQLVVYTPLFGSLALTLGKIIGILNVDWVVIIGSYILSLMVIMIVESRK